MSAHLLFVEFCERFTHAVSVREIVINRIVHVVCSDVSRRTIYQWESTEWEEGEERQGTLHHRPRYSTYTSTAGHESTMYQRSFRLLATATKTTYIHNKTFGRHGADVSVGRQAERPGNTVTYVKA